VTVLARTNFQGKRILVAVDDALLAAMLTVDLADLGFATVDVVRSLEAALQSARSLHPDVLLLDLHLAGGHVDAFSTYVSIPLVLISDDPASSSGLGLSVPVMSKPFTPAALEDALARVVLSISGG